MRSSMLHEPGSISYETCPFRKRTGLEDYVTGQVMKDLPDVVFKKLQLIIE